MAYYSPDYKRLLEISITLAIVLAIVVTGLSAYLLIVGQKGTGYYDQSPEEIAQGVQPTIIETYEPYPAAIFPLISSSLLLIGLVKRENHFVFAWAGLVFLLIFSVLFLFSSGGTFLPFTVFFLILLVMITIFQRKETGQPETN